VVRLCLLTADAGLRTRAYPELKIEDIQEAILYARASLDHTEFKVANA